MQLRTLPRFVRFRSGEFDEFDPCPYYGHNRLWLFFGRLFIAMIIIGGSAMVVSPYLSEPEANLPQAINSPQAIVPNNHVQLVQAGAFSPDGRAFAACGLDHAVRVWDVSRLQDGACR